MIADDIEHTLRDWFLTGDIAAGARLVELELCERLGASRTPVREALHRLQRDGLITASGRGLAVVALGPSELDDAYRVRAVLEGLAAEGAAERQSRGLLAPAALATLGSLQRAADKATRAGRLAEGTSANRSFHLAVVDLAANAALRDALVPLWDRIHISTRAQLRRPARVAEVDQQHRVIVEAITAGRPATARKAAEAHVNATRAAVRPSR